MFPRRQKSFLLIVNYPLWLMCNDVLCSRGFTDICEFGIKNKVFSFDLIFFSTTYLKKKVYYLNNYKIDLLKGCLPPHSLWGEKPVSCSFLKVCTHTPLPKKLAKNVIHLTFWRNIHGFLSLVPPTLKNKSVLISLVCWPVLLHSGSLRITFIKLNLFCLFWIHSNIL